ncbi:Linoleoyl-CoA desaturase [Lunatimonas lonarensis]|uniref:Linoleoyl-CoA desaturase n=2 Tax=Lunatimonas lonarensis TaxID=1232681 RepID=R7ZM37_9BACT|nr:Linoleoyl-CoA desaturase [Lunatimonas lonarensis]
MGWFNQIFLPTFGINLAIPTPITSSPFFFLPSFHFLMRPPRFNQASLFHIELKHRIKTYFAETKLSPTGNSALYFKALFFIIGFVSVYIHLVFFTPHWAPALLESVILAAFAAGIGFNVMHDGAHGSFSKKEWINEMAGLSINFLGANVFMWKTKHNIAHHSFTNVADHDDDMNARPLLRLCPTQKKYSIHNYQHIYFLFVYAILYLYWVFVTDYKKYISRKVGSIAIKPMTWKEHVSFWGYKAIHALLFLVLPIYTLGFNTWIVGFLVFSIATGIFLSLVFQLAHSLEETTFPLPDQGTNQLENDWAVHQLRTTANFATSNKILSWLVGGLNFQVEHHLFPNISHVHYYEISKIIKATCAEFGVPYLEHPKMRLAIASHVNHLRNLGSRH